MRHRSTLMGRMRGTLIPALHKGERGTALTSALFLGMVMVLLTAVIITRGLNQSDIEHSDSEWEQSLHVAEGGINETLVDLNVDNDFTTGEVDADLQTKEEIITAADAKPAADLVVTPEGEFIVLKPSDADVAHTVGYTPSRDAANRQIRVVTAVLEEIPWVPGAGFLMGGNIEIKARKDGDKKEVDVTGTEGRIHVNGTLKTDFDWEKPPADRKKIDGCVTANVLDDNGNKHPRDGMTFSTEDTSAFPDCPLSDDVETVGIPPMDPRLLWKYSHYVICPTGAYYGPNWPMGDGTPLPMGATAGTVPADITTLDQCGAHKGSLIPDPENTLGIEDGIDKPDDRIKLKDKKDSVTGPAEGVWYFYERNVEFRIEDDQLINMTIITDRLDSSLDCYGGGKLDGKKGQPSLKNELFGDVKLEVKKRAWIKPHPDAGPGQYAVLSIGDIEIKAKGDVKKEDQGTIWGFVGANEQVKMEATDISDPLATQGGFRGSLVVRDNCDTHDSRKDKNEWKKGDIHYDGEIKFTDFPHPDGQEKRFGVLRITER